MEDAILVIPEAILASCETSNHGKSVTEWLIQWKHQPTEEVAWEEKSSFRVQFPYFYLEDKAVLKDAGIDGSSKFKPKVLQVFSHKPKVDGGKNSFE